MKNVEEKKTLHTLIITFKLQNIYTEALRQMKFVLFFSVIFFYYNLMPYAKTFGSGYL